MDGDAHKDLGPREEIVDMPSELLPGGLVPPDTLLDPAHRRAHVHVIPSLELLSSKSTHDYPLVGRQVDQQAVDASHASTNIFRCLEVCPVIRLLEPESQYTAISNVPGADSARDGIW